MPTHTQQLLAIDLHLRDGGVLSQALMFHGYSSIGDTAEQAHGRLARLLRTVIAEMPLLALHQVSLPEAPELATLPLTLEPGRRNALWTSPIDFNLPYVRWQHDESTFIGYVPGVGVQAMARVADELPDALEKEVRFAFRRLKVAEDLAYFVRLHRGADVSLAPMTIAVEIKTERERDQAAREAEGEKSVLEQVATNLLTRRLHPGYEIDDRIARLADLLGGRQRRSVLLIGASGVGKTATVHELVRQRAQRGFRDTPFFATSGSRIVAGMSGFGMWQDRCQKLWTEATKKKAIVHLGNLFELSEVGRSKSNLLGVASFLRPYIARGDVVTIAECTAEQFSLLEQSDPQLVAAFTHLTIDEPNEQTGRAILLSRALALSPQRRISVDIDAIETIDRLHRRYATYSAYPGRPLRFLRNLVQDSPMHSALTVADVHAAFSRETGLPLFMLSDAEPLDLAESLGFFDARVMGQRLATQLVLDVLAMVKAGLTRPGRPIASLLFIGPTGVGKTEMAKGLAEFLFGSRERMTRFDMSEFQTLGAVERLIGGSIYAGKQEGLLTAKVREQPFSVLLFDEVEKAHPGFFDLLLQVFGDGRLTDGSGRVADFRNTVIVMTSNLGAESYRPDAPGFAADPTRPTDTMDHFVAEVRAFLRPEMFNRIDRIVPFGPLDSGTIRRVTDRELALLRGRDGLVTRTLKLTIEPAVADRLARVGYDLRYGARPLKRAIERDLLVPLADAINEYAATTPLNVDIVMPSGTAFQAVSPPQSDITTATSASSTGVPPVPTLPIDRPATAPTAMGMSPTQSHASRDTQAHVRSDTQSLREGASKPAEQLSLPSGGHGRDAGATRDASGFTSAARGGHGVELPATDLKPQIIARADTDLLSGKTDQSRLTTHATTVQTLRRSLSRLAHHSIVHDIRNQIYRLKQQDKRVRARAKTILPSGLTSAEQSRHAHLERLLERVESTAREGERIETEVLKHLYRGRNVVVDTDTLAQIQRSEDGIQAALGELLIALYAHQYPSPNDVMLTIYGEDKPTLQLIARGYAHVADEAGYTVEGWRVLQRAAATKTRSRGIAEHPGARPASESGTKPAMVTGAARDSTAKADDAKDGDDRSEAPDNESGKLASPQPPLPKVREDIDRLLHGPTDDMVAIVLSINGQLAYPRLRDEGVVHNVVIGDRTVPSVVLVHQVKPADYVVPPNIERRGSMAGLESRRVYDINQGVLIDRRGNQREPLGGGAIGPALARHLDRQLHDAIKRELLR